MMTLAYVASVVTRGRADGGTKQGYNTAILPSSQTLLLSGTLTGGRAEGEQGCIKTHSSIN